MNFFNLIFTQPISNPKLNQVSFCLYKGILSKGIQLNYHYILRTTTTLSIRHISHIGAKGRPKNFLFFFALLLLFGANALEMKTSVWFLCLTRRNITSERIALCAGRPCAVRFSLTPTSVLIFSEYV